MGLQRIEQDRVTKHILTKSKSNKHGVKIGFFPATQYSCLENPMDRATWWAWNRKEMHMTEGTLAHTQATI